MKYVISDIHGCYNKYMKMIGMIGLRDEDTLFVLGDAVDRGDGGIDVLLDMFSRKNVVPLMGNHDFSALNCLRMLSKDWKTLTKMQKDVSSLWLSDGGMATYEGFIKLSDGDKEKILSYISTFTYFETETAGENKFFLSHTVPEKDIFLDRMRQSVFDYITGEPDYEEVYDDGMYIVTGHTPTELIDPASAGRIWRGNRHIAIDCGAVFGAPLGGLCLDTLEEFYAD